jgi:hypothetical protein
MEVENETVVVLSLIYLLVAVFIMVDMAIDSSR